ncbi:MAG: rhodanese-like domain-containing protein [Firmicutes bacterium]|nr:rhodanese-like domain-containing protein [Bacillota bacterium]
MSCPLITLPELHSHLFRGDVQIVDVREIAEYRASHIEGSTLIPLAELPFRTDEIDRNREVIVVCKSGNRSTQACELLRERGFQNTRSLAGGLASWSA